MRRVPGRFEIVARRRPVRLVAPGFVQVHAEGPGTWAVPQPAPYVAATAVGAGEVVLGAGDAELAVELAGDVISLRVTTGGRTTRHRSRRFGRLPHAPEELGITVTGTWLTAFAREAGRWVARARYDLRERLDVRAEAFCADLHVSTTGGGAVEAGAFGQLGLRDVRLVTEVDGTPVRDGPRLLLTATHAGPGFFDTAHTGVWSLDPDEWRLEHRADLFFRRPEKPGVYGDNATHLVRDGASDGAGWLVATSTWGDFSRADKDAAVTTTIARSDADLTRGRHVLDTRALRLPTTGLRSVGTWDPHLVRSGDSWLVAFVTASRFFRFHPALAAGPDLDSLELVAADPSRTATEGPTLAKLDGEWRLLASDGRDGPRERRMTFPVFDLALEQVGTLDAPYPTNLPWPTIVETDSGWALVMFDGTRAGGDLVGYGTHGDVVVATASR
jgi:hypothetical protein